jgi:hypothetical protein
MAKFIYDKHVKNAESIDIPRAVFRCALRRLCGKNLRIQEATKNALRKSAIKAALSRTKMAYVMLYITARIIQAPR